MFQLKFVAGVQALLYASLYLLNDAFAYSSDEQERPILPMLAIFAASFAIYFAAIPLALRCSTNSRLIWLIAISALVFRCILLPTAPIQEVDIYRYLWDGAATARGVNPYRYSPALVVSASHTQTLPADLQQLVQLRDNSPVMAVILNRIHFADLPTVYPPVSQAVFALGDLISPATSSVETRVLILKGLLVLFDIGTCGLLWSILVIQKMHPGWVIAYAWCPLVLKEFANTGHLDSIAVFFTTATVWSLAKLFSSVNTTIAVRALFLSGVVFALAVGAKLYPLVLLPVLTAAIAAKMNLKKAVLYGLLVTLVAGLLVAPMLLTEPSIAPPAETTGVNPTVASSVQPRQETGLRAFLTLWEMNDFLFMLVEENLRPVESHVDRPLVWFAVVPNSWRESVVSPFATLLDVEPKTAAFLMTRVLTTVAFLVISLAFACQVFRRGTLEYFLEATFLSLAWFWLLSPTQNPWYLTWALPFLPFARGRGWIALSGLTFVYYFRFWLRYHFSGVPLVGTPYEGAQFFDFIITWVEYLPWLMWLGISAIRRHHPPPDLDAEWDWQL